MDPFKLVKLVILILGVPLVIGMTVRHYKPKSAIKIMKYLRPFSIFIFFALIIIAFSQNLEIFTKYIHYVFFIVILHNIIGLVSGFYFAKLMKLDYQNQKTLSIETGIQNSGLGLLLVFAFFDGLGGMALLVAFWGIWDLVSGLLLAGYWAKKDSIKPIKA